MTFFSLSRVSAHFTCSSVLSELVFDGIFFSYGVFGFYDKNRAPSKNVNQSESG